jgi:hypothetical protein
VYLLHCLEEEEQRNGGDRQADQEQVFREREEAAHPGDERDTAPVSDDDIARQIEQNGKNEVSVTEKEGDDI